MDIFLYFLKEVFTTYIIVGCVFTLVLGVIAYLTETLNDYTTLEVFIIILIYPVIIYYVLNPEKDEKDRKIDK
jgi:quinol-cytochrome oxidoreductase complex cytochrome b subunit